MRKDWSNLYVLISIIAAILLQADSLGAQSQEALEEQKIQKAQEYYSAGKQLLQQGDYSAANNEFKKAESLLGATPPRAAVEPVEALPKDAISGYLKAVKLEPKNTALHYNLALEYLKGNEFKNAEEEFKRIIELNPNDKDACYNLGVLYENYFNYKKQAIYYYSRYIKLAPQAQDARQVRMWIKQLKKQLAGEK